MKYIEMDQELIKECLREEIDIDKLAKGWGISHADALAKAVQIKKDFELLGFLLLRTAVNGKLDLTAMQKIGPILERMGASIDEAADLIKFTAAFKA